MFGRRWRSPQQRFSDASPGQTARGRGYVGSPPRPPPLSVGGPVWLEERNTTPR
ncbi:hypothetical protein PO909_004204 [Leuciscus waleckii]